jgi:uncharacterized membrane protein YeaQ/YmgE (transglycosylase-associated protein family)
MAVEWPSRPGVYTVQASECGVSKMPSMVLGLTVANVNLDPGGCFAWVFAALVAGWLAGSLARGRGFGCLGDIVLGLVGAVLGVLVLGLLQVQLPPQLGFFGTTGVAFLGAFLLALIGRLIGGQDQTRQYRDWRH